MSGWRVRGNDKTLQKALEEINLTDREKAKAAKDVKLAESKARLEERKAALLTQREENTAKSRIETTKVEGENEKARLMVETRSKEVMKGLENQGSAIQGGNEQAMRGLENQALTIEGENDRSKLMLETRSKETIKGLENQALTIEGKNKEVIRTLDFQEKTMQERFKYENKKIDAASKLYSENIDFAKTALQNNHQENMMAYELSKVKKVKSIRFSRNDVGSLIAQNSLAMQQMQHGSKLAIGDTREMLAIAGDTQGMLALTDGSANGSTNTPSYSPNMVDGSEGCSNDIEVDNDAETLCEEQRLTHEKDMKNINSNMKLALQRETMAHEREMKNTLDSNMNFELQKMAQELEMKKLEIQMKNLEKKKKKKKKKKSRKTKSPSTSEDSSSDSGASIE